MKCHLVLGLGIALLACSSSSKHGSIDSGTSSPTGTGGKGATGTGGINGTGGKGATGAGGTRASTGGSGATGTGGSGTTSAGASVLERNNHPSRDGHFLQPTLTQANVTKMATDATFKATFTGNMFASPLYLENGPLGKGLFFAVTTDNQVFAIDETTGSTSWMTPLGDSPTANGVSCGDIHPLGIVSTPVIDATARTIYVAGAIGTNSIMRHEVHALSVDDGKERSGWPIDVSKLKSGTLSFMPPPQNQRSALSLVRGTLYVAYGGHNGDCGPYHGWVIGIDAADPTKVGAWATLGQGEGIWAAGGMASDGNGVFAITGNSTVGATDRVKSDSEQVVHITGLATFDRADTNLYYPKIWQQMDSQDADFGSSSPVYIEVPGATPSKYVVAVAKDGHLYMLDSANLGGMGGEKADLMVATGSSLHTALAAYTTPLGVHVVFSTDGNASMCPSNGPNGRVMMSVLIPAGAPPVPTVAWCAALSGSVTAPIATTKDGQNEAIVWFMNNGKLTAVDGDKGHVLYTSSDTCSAVRHWTAPIAVKGRIVVGGDGHLCSWSLH